MTLAALIRKSESVRFATATPATVATLEGDKARAVATVATVSVANSPQARTATASRWWLLHYPDRQPTEFWSSPPATHAEIMEWHPEAIAAEPIDEATPEPAQDCSICAYITRHGRCGEPMAAGLSNLPCEVRYNSDERIGCQTREGR